MDITFTGRDERRGEISKLQHKIIIKSKMQRVSKRDIRI